MVLNEIHSAPLVGHFGTRKVLHCLSNIYCGLKQPMMLANSAANIMFAKVSNILFEKKMGLLQPLSIPAIILESCSISFITDLPVLV